MSNPQSQGSQGPQQQQAGQLLKADDLSKLRCLTDDQKQKYRPVLQNFWGMMQTKPAGSQEHNQARAKLHEWSQKLINQERQFRLKQQQMQQQGQNQQNQQAQASQQAPAQPTPEQPQASAQQQQPQAQAQAQPQTQQPAAQASNQPAQQGNRPQGPGATQPSPEVVKHVNSFPYYLPPDGPMPGTPQAEQAYQQMRQQYLAQLTRQERSSNRMKALSNILQQRKQAGQEIPPELMNQKSQIEKEYHGAKTFVEDFRKRQKEWQSQGGRPVHGHQQQQQQSAQQPGQTQQQSPTQSQPQSQQPAQNAVKQEPQIKVEGGQAPQAMQQQFNNMQGGGPQQQQQQQNAQASTPSSAQQPRPPPTPLSQQQMSQQQVPQQNQGQFAQPGQQQHPPRPQINPQQANAQLQQQSNSPHPQSATSAAGQPIPLSHHAAVSAANRSYSQPDGQRTTTPLQGGQGSFHAPGSREREQLNNPKMPIPRTLNVTPVTPVGMGQARPTMSGPTNGAPGPMGQPVINKFPPFQLEGEGDRVLSKRKLDELVRQVTGGSEDALTPEVEEAMLQLADEFVDTVITSACKLSKLRESPNLEIRDIQVILERNYNIRIPGYASDEVRTVRKLVPATGWTQKMNAVQAAKVMGGKTDI